MRRCFKSEPKLPPVSREEQQFLGTVRFYSFEALRVALNQRDMGRNASIVFLGGHEIPRGVVLLYLTHLEAVRDWKQQRQFCWLLFYAGLAALSTCVTAVGVFMLFLSRPAM